VKGGHGESETSNYNTIFYYIIGTIGYKGGGKGEVPPSTRLGVDVACVVLPVDVVGVNTVGIDVAYLSVAISLACVIVSVQLHRAGC